MEAEFNQEHVELVPKITGIACAHVAAVATRNIDDYEG